MESLGDILKRLQQQSISARDELPADWLEAVEGTPNEPTCPICGGQRWVRHDVPVTHADFGKAFPCTCQLEASEEQRMDRLHRFSNMGRLAEVTFEATDPRGPGASTEAHARFTAALAAALIAILGSPGYGMLLGLGFVVGGLSSPLYPLSVAETNDWLEEKELVPAGAGMVLAYSLGASVGPLAASVVMDQFGHAGLFAFAACALAVLALFALYRVVKGLSKPVEEQTDFWPASWVTRWPPRWTRAARTSPTTTRAPRNTGKTTRFRKTKGSGAYTAAFSSSLRRATKALSSSSMAGSIAGCS